MVTNIKFILSAVDAIIKSKSGRFIPLVWSFDFTSANVSIVDFVAVLEKEDISAADVNNALKEASQGSLANILGYSDLPLVSSDFNGSSLSSIVDAPTTYSVDNMVKVLAWYDNEAGYSHRMIDLAAMIGKQL